MSHLIKSWNNRTIRIHPDNRYVCLTDMAHATGKRFYDWSRLDGSKSYLRTLSAVTQIPVTELVQTIQGGTPESQGTWGHPKVALRFAQWCSDEFAVQVDFWIDELLNNGSVSLTKECEAPLMLPAQQIDIIMRGLEYFDIDKDNPRIKQGLQDTVLNILIHQPQLPASTERWLGAAERAEELGYGRVGADLSVRTRLGQHVSKCGLERRKEERLCNGTQRSIWIYRICDRLDDAISSFFELHLL